MRLRPSLAGVGAGLSLAKVDQIKFKYIKAGYQIPSLLQLSPSLLLLLPVSRVAGIRSYKQVILITVYTVHPTKISCITIVAS